MIRRHTRITPTYTLRITPTCTLHIHQTHTPKLSIPVRLFYHIPVHLFYYISRRAYHYNTCASCRLCVRRALIIYTYVGVTCVHYYNRFESLK